MKIFALLSLSLFCVGCASRPAPPPPQEPMRASSFAREPHADRTPAAEKKIIRSSRQTVSVNSTVEATRETERVIRAAGGYVEQSSTGGEGKVWLRCRVPAAKLDGILDTLAALGEEEDRSLSAEDVTEQYADTEARLKTQIALRDRLQQLLDRAKDVNEVLSIERELSRVQTEIESMQSRIDRLKSQVQMSSLHVTLAPRHILGPLGYVGYGIGWAASKLFIIR
jgi:hypothetical protein